MKKKTEKRDDKNALDNNSNGVNDKQTDGIPLAEDDSNPDANQTDLAYIDSLFEDPEGWV